MLRADNLMEVGSRSLRLLGGVGVVLCQDLAQIKMRKFSL